MDIIVIVIVIALALYAETAIYGKFGLYGITYRVYLSEREAYEGDEIEIIEEVVNQKLLPIPWLKSEIYTSSWLDFAGTASNEAAKARFAPSVFALRPYQKCVRKWRVKCLKRGVFRLDDTTIVTCDIFGFVNNSAKIKVDEYITVLPRPLDIADEAYADKNFIGDDITRRFICPDPFLISGTREYTGSEPLSRVHWNATAKRGGLMVYNNDYTTECGVLIAINMQKREGGKVIPAYYGDVEYYIKLAAAILDQCARSGFRAGFFSNGGGNPDNDGGSESSVYIPACPVRKFGEILRGLAALDEKECRTDFAASFRRVDLSDYTDVVVITPYLSESVVAALKNTRLNVRFYTSDVYETDCAVIPLTGR